MELNHRFDHPLFRTGLPPWLIPRNEEMVYKPRITKTPGSVIDPPRPYQEQNELIDEIKRVLIEIRQENQQSLFDFDMDISDDTIKRLLWFTGGSARMAVHFLQTDQPNLATYSLFYETRNGMVHVLEPHPEKPHVNSETIIGDCTICLVSMTAANNASLSCGHLVCFDCAFQYIEGKVRDGKTSPSSLVCPGQKCDLSYNSYHVFSAANFDVNSDLLTRYLSFNVQRAFEASPFLRYCSNKRCNKEIIAVPQKRRVYCTACQTSTCSKCKKKYHKFPLCRRRENGALSPMKMRWYYLWHGTRPCPNCNFLIEKTKGCDHMTCAKCDYEFCWRCSKKYTPDHFSNPLNCNGGAGASWEIWGPLLPFKALYEFGKDVSIALALGVGATLISPYLAYACWDEISEFGERRVENMRDFASRFQIRGRNRQNVAHYVAPQQMSTVNSSLF